MQYFVPGYNSITELTTEMIANEALAILFEEQILANYVSIDFNEEFAQEGDIVKAVYPIEMEADRTPEGDDAAVNTIAAGSHEVKLNQHITQAFQIGDREQQRSFVDLVNMFIRPAARSLAVKRDRIIQGEIYGSHVKAVGHLDQQLAYADVIQAGTYQTEAYVPTIGRNIVCGPRLGANFRNMTEFVANVSKTDPSIIRSGFIGDVNGFAVHETASFSHVAYSTKRDTETDVAASEGDTTVAVDDMTGTIVAGSWCTVNGVPYRIVSHTGGATPTAFVIDSPLREDVAIDKPVSVYTPSVVNHPSAGTYAAGYEGKIGFDGGVAPKLGQGVTFGTDGIPYSVVKVTGTDVWLNRPLDAAVANDANMFLMPGGNYGIGIYRNSIQLVNRPMIAPQPDTGVQASTISGDGWSMRVQRTRSMLSSKDIIMLDFLMGVANINPGYNVLFLG